MILNVKRSGNGYENAKLNSKINFLSENSYNLVPRDRLK